METLQYEALKVALKQDKTGYVLTLCIHPDEIPDPLLRDFVGSRYQVVMVRLNEEDRPIERKNFDGQRAVRKAAILCRDPDFWDFLYDDLQIMDKSEKEATEWMRNYLNIQSRSELNTNVEARQMFEKLDEKFEVWKRN